MQCDNNMNKWLVGGAWSIFPFYTLNIAHVLSQTARPHRRSPSGRVVRCTFPLGCSRVRSPSSLWYGAGTRTHTLSARPRRSPLCMETPCEDGGRGKISPRTRRTETTAEAPGVVAAEGGVRSTPGADARAASTTKTERGGRGRRDRSGGGTVSARASVVVREAVHVLAVTRRSRLLDVLACPRRIHPTYPSRHFTTCRVGNKNRHVTGPAATASPWRPLPPTRDRSSAALDFPGPLSTAAVPPGRGGLWSSSHRRYPGTPCTSRRPFPREGAHGPPPLHTSKQPPPRGGPFLHTRREKCHARLHRFFHRWIPRRGEEGGCVDRRRGGVEGMIVSRFYSVPIMNSAVDPEYCTWAPLGIVR